MVPQIPTPPSRGFPCGVSSRAPASPSVQVYKGLLGVAAGGSERVAAQEVAASGHLDGVVGVEVVASDLHGLQVQGAAVRLTGVDPQLRQDVCTGHASESSLLRSWLFRVGVMSGNIGSGSGRLSFDTAPFLATKLVITARPNVDFGMPLGTQYELNDGKMQPCRLPESLEPCG